MNWTQITDTAVNATKDATLLANVRSRATEAGVGDPFPEIAADVVSTIRARISVGNTLDADPTKIPKSLKGVALRMIVRRLKDYIQFSLTEIESNDARDDASYLNRITDDKIRFESPDTPAGDAEMQQGSTIEVQTAARPYANRHTMNGLL